MSRGLFHRVIAQSGVAIHDVGVDARARAFRAGKILGIDTTSEKDLLDYLRKLDDKRLVNLTVATLTPDEMLRGPPAQFVPVIEKRFRNVEAFINEHPVKMLVENKINKVPLMIGYNSAEGLIAVDFQATLLDIYNKEPSYYIPKEVVDRVTTEQLKNLGDRIKKFYVGNGNFTTDDLDTIADLITDLHFSRPTPSNYFGVNWKPYTKQGKEYFNIEEPFSMGNYADRKRMEFWNSIYAEAGLPNISN
ncbi:unnamed protein product [Danaus chrysippus]|uniref:(African queen) hypothetical protein n=1 Tax=Danaus chrysippus TaxID=151541 RepID=A0A8J2QET8_9NEOP|nr:unnamed protein product [Danaus chrysippus]